MSGARASRRLKRFQLVSVLPGNKKAAPVEPEPQLGDFNPRRSSARNAVSADGSRVFWSAVIEEHEAEVTKPVHARNARLARRSCSNAAQGVKEPIGRRAREPRKCTSGTPSATGRGCSSPTHSR